MTTTAKHFTGRAAATVALIWLATVVIGCAAQKKAASTAPDPDPGKIVGIVLESDAVTDRVRILGNRPLTFTAVSSSSPSGVTLHLPGTQLALEAARVDLTALETAGVVADVRSSVPSADGATALIEIDLKVDAPYDAVSQGNEVVVTFVRPLYTPETEAAPVDLTAAREAPASRAADDVMGPVATRLEAVTVQRLENGVEIRVRADGPIKDYSVFTLNDPDRIVYDIYGVTSPFPREQVIEVGTPWVSRVRHYGDPEKLRVVLDTAAGQFQATAARPIEEGLLVQVGEETRENTSGQATMTASRPLSQIDGGDFPADPTGQAVVTGAMTRPVSKREEKVSVDGDGNPRGSVHQGQRGDLETPRQEIHDTRSFFFKRKYSGEMISLDFYETDLKNVFRILGEVSGKNFAIDSDVRGTVTMSLDKPVPWDQVLDLVLKMNQLGQTMEGNVIRVATLETLAREEKALKDAIEAREDVLKSQEKLEPLFTETIDVNYSSAQVDILPKLMELLKEYAGDQDFRINKDDPTAPPEFRGVLSVYDPKNQIVIRGTKSLIEKARYLVGLLDKPTAQVLIEARIVEATKSFSRDIGTQFSIVGSPLAINAAIDASETEGETKTISAPKILTLDHEVATIKQGVSYPIVKLDEAGNTTTEFEEIVLELKVTPHVTKDERVSMEIMIAKDDIGERVGTNYSFMVNQATTKLLVNDGETVVIGGISKTKETNSETGLPGLRKIPLLGKLFGMSSKLKDKSELMIFITPRIVQLEQRPS
jgi:type IV pilus assembly protein PilQ